MMGHRLEGKVAIVTGAGCLSGPADIEPIGNGKAAAILYAEEGASVVAVDITQEAAEDASLIFRPSHLFDTGGPLS